MSRGHASWRALRLVQPTAPSAPSLDTGAPAADAPAEDQPAAPHGRWQALAAPVDPLETWLRMRAGSALFGFDFQDGSRYPDVLTIEQARDVLAWYAPRPT